MNYSDICVELEVEIGYMEKSYNGNDYLQIVISEEQFNKKKNNIIEFLSIDRNLCGLNNEKLERRIMLYYTAYKEKIYMQMPGKESNIKYAKELVNGVNPYDFRPELILENGTRIEKLSIENVIRYLDRYYQKLTKDYSETEAKTVFKVISAYLCRMCLMNDHYLYLDHFDSVLDYYEAGKIVESKVAETIHFKPYLLDNEHTKKVFGNFDRISLPEQNSSNQLEISIEGLLYYLDIFAQQEDCKYEYVYNYGPKEKDRRTVGIGRINFLLTIVNAMGRIEKNEDYEYIIRKSENGVEPVPLNKLSDITGNIVKENKKEHPEYAYIVKNLSGYFPKRSK